MNTSIYNKKVRTKDNILLALIYLSTIFAVLLLVCIIGFIAYKGISQISFQFLFTTQSVLKETFGVLGNIINTIYIIVISLVISLPLGIGTAVYLNEYAKNQRFINLVEFTAEVLSAIPSIIYGLFGMVFFGITLKLGFSILCGSLTLTIIILPLILRTTQEALRTVPKGYRDGAVGMGTTKWYMIRTIILPSALPGIITGTILSIGRIVGESAALLFTTGSSYLLPRNIFSHVLSSGGTLTIQMYLSMSEADYDSAFGIAFLLLVLVFIINLIPKVIFKRKKH